MSKNKTNKEYCNQFTINRANHKSNYTCITNHLIRDERLTATEKGIMLLILSNDDKHYVLNMSVLQKQCKLGDDKFNTSKRNLETFGYINKHRIQGGVHWVVNEIPKIIHDTGNANKKESTPSESTPSESNPSENTICVNTSLSINNTSAETGNPVPAEKEKEKNEINTNTRGRVENSENFSLSKGNDLALILQESTKFKMIYESNTRQGGVWAGLDVTAYSNSYIAFLIACKLKNEPLPNDIDNGVVILLQYMVKYSKIVKDSQLWTSFLKEVDYDNNIINKLGE